MDQSEIVRSYREAKNKEKQIQILADLNGSSPEQIRKILIAAGEPAEKKETGTEAKGNQTDGCKAASGLCKESDHRADDPADGRNRKEDSGDGRA